MQKMKLEHFPAPYEKMNSLWVKDINGRPKAIEYYRQNPDKNHVVHFWIGLLRQKKQKQK